MSKVAILDLETLDVTCRAVILSVGLLVHDTDDEPVFNDLVKKGIEIKLAVGPQASKGRTISKDTLQWWGNQGAGAKRVLDPDAKRDVDLITMDKIIRGYFKDKGFNPKKDLIYARGSHFDFAILENMYKEDLKIPAPWPHWNIRDARTVIDTMLGTTRGKLDVKCDGFVAHNALHDCAMEVMMINKAMEILDECTV